MYSDKADNQHIQTSIDQINQMVTDLIYMRMRAAYYGDDGLDNKINICITALYELQDKFVLTAYNTGYFNWNHNV